MRCKKLLLATLLSMASLPGLYASEAEEPEDAVLESVLGEALSGRIKAWDAAFLESRREHARDLVQKGDPRSLLGAVLLYPGEIIQHEGSSTGVWRRPPAVHEWFVRARAMAPDDRLLAWVEAVDCPVDASQCDRADALERLHRLDPTNAAVWLESMRDAQSAGDEGQAEILFERSAQANRYDVYDLALGALLLESDEGFEPPPMPSDIAELSEAVYEQAGMYLGTYMADAHLLGVWVSHAIPALQTPVGFCLRVDELVGDAARQASCRTLFALMAEDSSMAVTRQLSLGIMIRLTRETPQENRLWRERYREYQWQSQQMIDRLSPVIPTEGYARDVLTNGELAAWRAFLDASGVSLTPPEGWLPDHPSYRSLILTGRSGTGQ